MSQTRTPLLVGAAAAAALLARSSSAPTAMPVGAHSGALAAVAAASPGDGGLAGQLQADGQAVSAGDEHRVATSRRRFAHLYREFLAIDPAPPVSDATTARLHGSLGMQPVSLEISSEPRERSINGSDLSEIADTAALNGYELQFMIALVADPIDSRLASDFDLAMNAVQQGLADVGYQFDRKWLPWAEPDSAEQRSFRETPGMMLFRRDRVRAGRGSLLAVFLVGETPKLGIDKSAFLRAVDFIHDLHEQSARLCGPPLRLEIPVLGPTYSGSADSLQIALRRAPQLACFRVVSGSATGGRVATQLVQGNLEQRVHFNRTVVPDHQLARIGLQYLEKELGWNLDHAALLIENDTVYGSSFLEPELGAPPIEALQRIKKWSFPNGLFALRNAWEGSGAFSPPAQAIAGNPKAFATPKTALEVSLADKRPPVDVVPELSPLTSRIDDMAVANLLRQIAKERISYVGILATDVKDELFLAEQVRRWAPNVILFVVDNDLLYLHPQYGTAMFGALTLSSFPLATEGAESFLSPAVPAGESRLRRQFSSAWQEGTFLAVETLAGRPPATGPKVWIAATGNYAMWPLARLDAEPVAAAQEWRPPVERLGPTAVEALPRAPASPRPIWDPQLLFLVLVACFASHQLHRRTAAMAASLPRVRNLLSAATALLCLPAAALAGIWAAELWIRPVGGDDPEAAAAWLFWCFLLAGYAYLGWGLAKTVPMYQQGRAAWLACLLFIVAVVPVLTWVAFANWGMGIPELLHHRLRAFSGGMSPVVSLAWLAAALFFWLCVELMRQLVRERHKAPWPFDNDFEPALAGTRVKAQRLSFLLKKTSPRGYRAAALLIVATPALVLWARVQPIAESRLYGRFFVLLCAAASTLSVFSFLRFVVAWLRLRQLLRRIAETDLMEALSRIADETDWKPMQFSWYVPSFTVLRKTVARLQNLIKRGLVTGCGTADELRNLLEALFQAAADGSFHIEMEVRNDLRRRFVQATRQLVRQRQRQGVNEFYAVRLVAYLRLVFTQLRYSLMGAMGCGLPVILAAATYGFQPKRYAMLVLWGILGVASACTLTVFVQMDRDAALSAIAGTPAGQVTYDWSFLSNALTYGVLPVLGLVASQFPSAGRLFSSLLDPLARILGVG